MERKRNKIRMINKTQYLRESEISKKLLGHCTENEVFH